MGEPQGVGRHNEQLELAEGGHGPHDHALTGGLAQNAASANAASIPAGRRGAVSFSFALF